MLVNRKMNLIPMLSKLFQRKILMALRSMILILNLNRTSLNLYDIWLFNMILEYSRERIVCIGLFAFACSGIGGMMNFPVLSKLYSKGACTYIESKLYEFELLGYLMV